MKRVLLICLIFTLTSILAFAQEGEVWTGIVDICGEDVLAINASDDLPENETTTALDNLLEQFVTYPAEEADALQQGVPAPGAVILVDTPDGRYLRSIGAGSIDMCDPIDPSNPFPIGSNTKMFTAAVIFQLHEEGLLSIDDLVSDYLPEEIALFEGAESITIEMLLGHTSGLPDYLNSTSPTSIGVQLGQPDSEILDQAFTPRELIENSAESDPMVFAPGTEAIWSYSNTGYIMLGMIIEQVTEQSYIDAVTQRVIDPLEMDRTFVADGIVPADVGMVGQYLIDGDPQIFVEEVSGWHTSQAWSAGSIVSTAEDMVTFLRAYYSGELFEDSATLDILLTRAAPGYVGENDDLYYLHGGYYKAGFLGHGGQTLGTESDVGYNPEYGITIVTWSNTAYAYTGAGVFHIGNALGLTPSFMDVLFDIQFGSSDESQGSALQTISVAEVLGIQLDSTGIYVAETEEFIAIPEDGNYYVMFTENEQLSIGADCNTVLAEYTVDDDETMTIELGATSLVACPEGSIADDFLAVISNTTTFKLFDSGDGFILQLITEDDSNTAFTAIKE